MSYVTTGFQLKNYFRCVKIILLVVRMIPEIDLCLRIWFERVRLFHALQNW